MGSLALYLVLWPQPSKLKTGTCITKKKKQCQGSAQIPILIPPLYRKLASSKFCNMFLLADQMRILKFIFTASCQD